MPPVNEAANDPATAHATQGAAHWLATLSDENCSEAERQQFLEWLRSSTQHVDEFLRLSTLARNASRRDLWPERSIETLITEARASTNVTAIDGGIRGAAIRTSKPVAWALAASATGILAVGALLFSGQLGHFFAPAYSTQIGEQRSIALSDGSVVELNSKSSLRTDFSETLRAVELTEGEAIFRVTKDPNRPFRVRAGTTDIVAVGTAFNVNASDSQTVVTVLEGRVRVNQHAGKSSATPDGEAANIELAMGEQLIVARGRAVVRLALHDTVKVTSWTERRLIFEDTQLSAAAAEFARYSPREIRIEDAQLGARRINGVFDATDPASLVEFLSSDETVEVRQQGEGWSVSSKPRN